MAIIFECKTRDGNPAARGGAKVVGREHGSVAYCSQRLIPLPSLGRAKVQQSLPRDMPEIPVHPVAAFIPRLVIDVKPVQRSTLIGPLFSSVLANNQSEITATSIFVRRKIGGKDVATGGIADARARANNVVVKGVQRVTCFGEQYSV